MPRKQISSAKRQRLRLLGSRRRHFRVAVISGRAAAATSVASSYVIRRHHEPQPMSQQWQLRLPLLPGLPYAD